MADRRGVLVPLVILAWIFLQPNPAAVSRIDDRPLIDDVIAEEQRSLAVLQNSSYDDAFGSNGHTLNLTGLEPDRAYAWESFSKVKGRAKEHLEYALGDWGKSALAGTVEEQNPTPLYSNISGYVRGQWKRSLLQEGVPIPQLNLSEYAHPGPLGIPGKARPFDRNVTGEGGEATVRFYEKGVGHVTSLTGLEAGNITEMRAELKVTDAKSSDEWEIHLRGVYFADIGQAVLATTSDKFAGIFALPHLALSERTFTSSLSLLNKSITGVIHDQIDRKTEKFNPWSSASEGSSDSANSIPDCDLVVYLQQMAPVASTQYSSAMLRFLEDELRFPTGAIVPSAPDMRFSMLVFSPDCGFVLESQGPPLDFAQDGNHLTGPKMEVQYRHSRHHLMLFTFAIAFQLFLLMRQMREANTPSTRSRISFYTIAMLALGDGFTTITFLIISLFLSGLWINLVGTGFLAFISVSFFGMRFLMDIWQVQAPERERRARAEVEEERAREERFQAALQRIRAERDARQAAIRAAATETNTPGETGQPDTTTAERQTPAPPAITVRGQTIPPPAPPTQPVIPPTTPGSLPLPATAPSPVDTGATPVFMPSDQQGLESIGLPLTTGQPSTETLVQARMPTFASLYTRFYLLLLASLFLSLNAMSWPAGARRVYFTMLALIYLSFWAPQINRNVQRNCRHALNWEFVLGQSILRLTPFIYFYGYRHNVLFSEVDYYGLGMLAVWIWIQVVVLGSQELLGPRWFIRKVWVPPAYDYHPVLREDEEGAAMPIGFSQANADASAPSSPRQERGSTSPIARRASIAKETKEKGKRVFDCAICMQDLEVPVIESGSSRDANLVGGVLARRNYMVTPCRHIFHSSCLEGWMKYRLQCPICRETLPPL
ncbi:Transmembrane E3 ubiquitin-protein ligase 1 [Fulvia fulva]|uniref:DSC E3 ubiquitin ligase complex subunit A n=1 Tax=Passalora fulva TaxID=5499 RepID=A0A9Q8L917_PASFU|nr:Transmembrane E3 ubiquitin-protein ligase 1 [Fulvia fulva]KAK4630989.1 Transmembrane E3 ubiquitin-protein ligase 1 [Fulvia fulva]KAK4633630.1 Transmembrane E3 ubiquitin-protein ligase 1 [Fulvia fulva]UJO13161.1 Transmembrane E3 ubiquitin-protein ligase 1 [Fulvia fulva]WPV10665.1 Transmembrane E3 ubiquitin-protein ligase 1 [Fulvia fulva]WPV26445.1 Transmembrane E3 ubiquitin-protein ligase 1 [Fulvia fulva]